MQFRLGEAAQILGVSVEVARRMADEGDLPSTRSRGGHRLIEGKALAAFAASRSEHDDAEKTSSSRNRFTGIVVAVQRDRAAASVEIQAGPHRIVSLITREAADALGLEPGVPVTASIKATNVSIDLFGES